MDKAGKFFRGDFTVELLLDKVNNAKGQFDQIYEWLISVDSFFTLEQLERNFVVVVVVFVLVVFFPHVPADLFVHEVKLLDFLAARAQQVRSDIVQPLVVLDVGQVPAFYICLGLNLLVKALVMLVDCLFDSQSRRSQGLEYWLTVRVQWYNQPVCVLHLVV